MQIGLVGFPGGGRSTLFKALTGLEPTPPTGLLLQHKSIGMVRVPDARLDWCREAFQPKKFTPAQVEFVDFAGIPRTAEKGKAELFAQIRGMDALILVVSAFDGGADASEVPGTPAARVKALHEEFLFADLEIIERRVEKLTQSLEKSATKTKDRDERELALMKRCRDAIENGKSLETIAQNREDEEFLTTYRFLTAKSELVVATVAEGQDRAAIAAQLAEGIKGPGAAIPSFAVLGKVEAEIAGMDPAERGAFLAEYGLDRPVVDAVIRAAFEATRRISFFTVGEDEVRAWEIRQGDSALVAAGRIHSDIARGFIRGEVIAFEDLKAAGSMKQAKADNKLRLEGKEYTVKDGDIVHFRFSV